MPLPDTVGSLPGHQVSHEAVAVLAAHEPLPLEDPAPSLYCLDPGSLPPEPVSGDAVLAALAKLDLARAAIAVLPLTGDGRSLYAATGHYEEEEHMAGPAKESNLNEIQKEILKPPGNFRTFWLVISAVIPLVIVMLGGAFEWLRSDISGIRDDISGIRDDISGIRDDIRSANTNLSGQISIVVPTDPCPQILY